MDITSVLLVLTLILGAVGVATIFLSILLISKETSKIPELVSRLIGAEMMLTQLINEVDMERDNRQTMWRSADGRYEASSFEELLHRMATDPDSTLSTDEIEAIQSVFKKISQKSDENPDSSEPWKQ